MIFLNKNNLIKNHNYDLNTNNKQYMMKIYYGVIDNAIDVTNICIEKLMKNNIIIIPTGDVNRSLYFNDHLFGVHKKIIIDDNGIINEYDEFTQIQINVINSIDKISIIHSKLKLNYGSLRDELPEQRMVVRYLTGNEKVLEIGGNIGRNSLVIASILTDNNFVTLESDVDIAKQLTENRDLNNFKFYIENSALSK
jgi:hypothetical protein